MGAGSSVAQSAENSSNSTTAVSFSDDEFHILIESFFDFYKHARRSGKDHSTIKSHSLWNFDRFESIPNDVISSYEHSNSTCIEQKIRIEYFRSISTIHPLRVRQHLFEYISSGILGIIGIEYDNLLAIMNRHEDQIKSLISATENLNLDSVDIQARKCTTISFTSSQETLLHTAIKRLDGSCEETEKECLLRNNSFPSHVFDFISYSLDGRRNFENEARKILIAYYLIFRGKLLPVILSLKNEILEWARKYDSDHSSANLTPCDDLPSPPIPAPAAVMGVSLRFLKEFIISNTIPSDMLTAKVVSDVIVPQTSATKETFINAHLLPTPHVVSDLRKGYNKNKKVLTVLGNGMCSEFDGFYCFLSHAWSMPFSELLCIAERAANVHFKSKTDMLTRICSPDDVLDCSFFWIDVFCKNQHIPAPAMDEFHQALKAPEVAVIALFPREPIAFQRIWCLFEIWTAVVNNITILPTMSEEAFSYFSANAKANFDSKPKLRVPVPAGDSTTIQLRKTVTEEFKASFMEEMKEKVIVRVEDSKATVPADIDTIMALIRQSTSVGKLNEDIFKAVCDTMWVRIESEYGYSKVTTTKYCLCGSFACTVSVYFIHSFDIVLLVGCVLLRWRWGCVNVGWVDQEGQRHAHR